jgi:GH24 family phage-related lysozyme (muramidase)
MSAQYELDFLPQLRINEGCFATMYSDTKGNVTCGVGFLLQTAAVAQGFPWYIPGLVTPATAQEIAAEWNRIKTMQPGQLPHYYAIETALQLRQEDIDAHLLGILDQTDEDLQRDYPGFETFPDAVKMALSDLDFNLGDAKLRNTYPKFDAAVDRQDWATAASQCFRHGISQARNDWTRQQFAGQTQET